MEIDQELAKKIIDGKEVIGEDGKYELKVTNVTRYERDLIGGRRQVAIVNLAAITDEYAAIAQEQYNAGLYKEAANNGISISVRDCDYYPMKGEILHVQIQTITTKKGITGQYVTGYKSAPLRKTTKMSVDNFKSKNRRPEESTAGRVEVKFEDEEEFTQPEFDAKNA
tara:strand:+ start:1185 stop:1688 length:504 start_codon:yes stop_codon:yes gene_type:complete